MQAQSAAEVAEAEAPHLDELVTPSLSATPSSSTRTPSAGALDALPHWLCLLWLCLLFIGLRMSKAAQCYWNNTVAKWFKSWNSICSARAACTQAGRSSMQALMAVRWHCLTFLTEWRLILSFVLSGGLLVFGHFVMEWLWDLSCAVVPPAIFALVSEIVYQVSCTCVMIIHV